MGGIDQYYFIQKKKWEKLAINWDDKGPPATPSTGDIINFRDLLNKSKIQNALLLGCTPSLRRLFCNDQELSSCKLVCVDFCEKMVEVTSSHIQTKNPNENFVISEWSQFTSRETFQVVIGDKVIDNVLPGNRNAFFRNLCNHLVENGRFIVHVALATDDFKNLTVEQIVSNWKEEVVRSNETIDSAVSGIWEDLLTASAFANGNYYDTVTISRYRDSLKYFENEVALFPDNNLEKVIFKKFLLEFGNSFDEEWTSYNLQDFENFMSPFFKITDIRYSSDYRAAKAQPIIELTKL